MGKSSKINPRIKHARSKFNRLVKKLQLLGFDIQTPEMIAADIKHAGIRAPRVPRSQILENQVILRKYFRGYYVDVITSYDNTLKKPGFLKAGKMTLVVSETDDQVRKKGKLEYKIGKKVYEMDFNRVNDFITPILLHAEAVSAMLIHYRPVDSNGKYMILKRRKVHASGERITKWYSPTNPAEKRNFFDLTKLPARLRNHILHLQSIRKYYRQVTRVKMRPVHTGNQVKKTWTKVKLKKVA